MTEKITLTDGTPVTPDHKEIISGGVRHGQQKGYVVLSAEERAKGFVRPVRFSYIHVGLPAPKNLRDLTEDEKERYADHGFVKYEITPRDDSHVKGRFWTQTELDKVNKGCNTVTKMGQSLAETYARDPKFYGGTFCCGCSTHRPLKEFVWEGTNETVGS